MSLSSNFIDTVLLIALFLCCIWQYRQTSIQWLWQSTPFEKDLQIQHLNLYPQSVLKIGNQVENKLYSQVLFRFIKRFYYPLNWTLIFDRWIIFFLPLFIIGLLFTKITPTVFILFFVPLIMTILIGYLNQGFHSFYPLIIYMSFNGLKQIKSWL